MTDVDESRMTDEERASLALVAALLTARLTRIELEVSLSGERCVRLYEHSKTKGGNDRWTPTGPLLFGDMGARSHADVLRHLAGIIEQAVEDDVPDDAPTQYTVEWKVEGGDWQHRDFRTSKTRGRADTLLVAQQFHNEMRGTEGLVSLKLRSRPLRPWSTLDSWSL